MSNNFDKRRPGGPQKSDAKFKSEASPRVGKAPEAQPDSNKVRAVEPGQRPTIPQAQQQQDGGQQRPKIGEPGNPDGNRQNQREVRDPEIEKNTPELAERADGRDASDDTEDEKDGKHEKDEKGEKDGNVKQQNAPAKDQ